jgi:hypothetical protein
VARAAAQSPQATSQSGPEGQSQGTFAPDTSGLSPAALAQAQRLPDWVYGIGASLQDALHKSGQARPVNMMAEVHGALDDLQGKGWLPDDLATGLKGHTGRIIPMLYELIRNEALLRNGIDRTAGGTALMGQTQGQQ